MILLFVIFFFLILRFAVTLFNFISNPKLPPSGRKYDEKVSILIPARNEEANLELLLQSILDQDYNNYEVIVLDDASSDATFQIAADFAASDQRFRVLSGKPLPKNWLGKNYACTQLAEAASGKWFLFLDADECIREGLLDNAIHRMKVNRLQLLSLFTNQIMKTTGERLVVPLMHFLLLNLLPLRLVRLSSNPAFSAASGQFMLFEAASYREYQWHELVKQKVVEDIEIMKLVKGHGLRAETLLANGFIHCRMYSGFGNAVQGFSKNVLSGFGNSVIALVLYNMLVVLGPLGIYLFLDLELLSFAIGLIVLTRIMISLASGQNPWLNILLHPVQMLAFVIISVVSIQKHLTRSVTWKGRNIHVK